MDDDDDLNIHCVFEAPVFFIIFKMIYGFLFFRAFETEVRMYDGDDPLDVWDR